MIRFLKRLACLLLGHRGAQPDYWLTGDGGGDAIITFCAAPKAKRQMDWMLYRCPRCMELAFICEPASKASLASRVSGDRESDIIITEDEDDA